MLFDIRIENNKIYKIRDLGFTAADLLEQLKQIEYKGNKLIKDKFVENAKLPPFIYLFYNFLLIRNCIPTPDELFRYYLHIYSKDTLSQNNDKYVRITCDTGTLSVSKEGLRARLFRSYPSIVRDFHMYLMLTESGVFDNVSYSVKRDYIEQVDITVGYKNHEYNIALSLDSSRSNYFRAIKPNRHNPIELIDVKLKIDDCTMCGDFYLFTKQDMNVLIDKIITKASSNQ